MKFKVLFITFNIVLFLSFLTIFLLPFFILDATFMADFWRKNWFFGVIFILVLGLVNFLFLSQWKMLSFLEKEDWPGLSQYLEIQILKKKKYGKRYIRLFCDSLILLGDFDTIRKLGDALEKERPALFTLFAPRFAASAILSGNYERAYAIAKAPLGAKGSTAEWLSFYAAFSRHLGRNYPESAERFIPLASRAADPLVAALSGYLCDPVLSSNLPDRAADLSAASNEAKKRVTGAFSRPKWEKYIDESKADMQVVLIGKLINDVTAWLFKA